MLSAKKGPQGKITEVSKEDNALVLVTDKGRIKLVPVRENIIRVVYSLAPAFSVNEKPGIPIPEQHSTWSWDESAAEVSLTTEKIRLVINRETSSISYFSKGGKLLAKEADEGGKTLIPFRSYRSVRDENTLVEKIETPDGIKENVLDGRKEFYKDLNHGRLEFEWSPEEALYGLGQQEEGSLNLRGTRQYVYQANMKIALPFLLSTRGYGILLDSYSPVIFNDNEYGSYLYSEAVEDLDYYFVEGENFDEIIGGYRFLTGPAVMLPKWAFGYMQSQERYESQKEIIDTVKEYRRRNVPLDCIVLDWQSWNEGEWGQKTFDAQRFPDPDGMTEELHRQGVHFMISLWPNMREITDNYREMKDKDLLFPYSETYNAFSPEARALYWKQANDGLFSHGVDAWWCDSSEPVAPEWTNRERQEPQENYTNFHKAARELMGEEFTNAYPLLHARTIYEGQRSVTDEKRVVNLTRSAYTGQQRYGTILWSGDISANWTTLKNQIPAGLNFCASGLPYWTLDIGAFFVKKGDRWFWNGDYEEGCDDAGYRELYTRWLQLGAFLPVFRSHGTDTRREIWNFGDKGDIFYDTIARYIDLRYRLLPYIYSLAGMVTLKDQTILRLLAFDFLNDPHVFNIKDQFMFGPSLMICPVTDPMYYGSGSVPLVGTEKSRPVYLPEGSVWYDFWTNEKYEGGQTIQADAPLETMPVYVRGGSLIPMARTAQHSGASSDSEIELALYPGADGSFTLYQDEKDNYNYEKGAWATLEISWKDREGKLTLGKRYGSFAGMARNISFTLVREGHKRLAIDYGGEETVVEVPR